MKFKWPGDWNRPLSAEEKAVARRLDRLTKEQLAEFDKEDCERREFFGQEA